MLVSVSVEAAKLVSLVPIVGRADVCIIGYDEVILSHLVLHLGDNWARVALGNLGQLSCLQELIIILLLEHGLEL